MLHLLFVCERLVGNSRFELTWRRFFSLLAFVRYGMDTRRRYHQARAMAGCDHMVHGTIKKHFLQFHVKKYHSTSAELLLEIVHRNISEPALVETFLCNHKHAFGEGSTLVSVGSPWSRDFCESEVFPGHLVRNSVKLLLVSLGFRSWHLFGRKCVNSLFYVLSHMFLDCFRLS